MKVNRYLMKRARGNSNEFREIASEVKEMLRKSRCPRSAAPFYVEQRLRYNECNTGRSFSIPADSFFENIRFSLWVISKIPYFLGLSAYPTYAELRQEANHPGNIGSL
ncbi:MAG: hypothetical protein ABIH92_03005 [Nanoarchaeota archaeon]